MISETKSQIFLQDNNINIFVTDKMYMALRLRVNLPEKKKRLRTDDEIELGKMHEHAEDLEHHLRCMNPNLTENTEHYLFLMRCLGDLGQVS